MPISCGFLSVISAQDPRRDTKRCEESLHGWLQGKWFPVSSGKLDYTADRGKSSSHKFYGSIAATNYTTRTVPPEN